MVVACIALFIALGGTSIAAVNFARNSGAVDGKSAVPSSASLSRAAGRLVATASRGPERGRLPGKFLSGVARTQRFGQATEVVDNARGAAVGLGGEDGIGSFSASCNDQSDRAGVEDPITTISFANQSGTTLNLARRLGNGDGAVEAVAPNTVANITVGGSNTFEYHVQHPNGIHLLVDGVVRQDGRATPTATCLFFGTILRVAP
jgi:hypothetical protein